jgi:hypothetical protein
MYFSEIFKNVLFNKKLNMYFLFFGSTGI